MWMLMLTAALAAEPTVTIENGAVVGKVVVEADEATTRAMLADATQMSTLTDSVLEAQVTGSGNCVEVARKARGMWRPLQWKAQRCLTEAGVTEALIPGGDFTEYQVDWTVESTAEGTVIEYTSRTGVNLPVPQSVVDKNSAQSAKELLIALARKLTSRRR